jgi:two-component system NtrC family sensor kinase
MEGTKQVSSGNLDYEILTSSKDEIGRLARAFNDMTSSLRASEQENRSWSETLEKRIQEKTIELRQIHERIMQIEKMASLGKLSATVAHELNNPLEGILTYSKLIARRLRKVENPNESVRQMIDDMELVIHEVLRCGNIVKNLLLFSKKQVGEFALVPIQGIIERAVQLMQHHFKISNVTFQVDYEAEATLMCDENQIQQAIVALFVNAVEAMPQGGRLGVRVARTSGGSLQVTVADSGVGIAPEDLPHVFEPFFTTKKEGKGVGLGLSVVYGIIERHGGSVAVQSEPSKGTVFTLSFPPSAMTPPSIQRETLERSPSA